MKTLYDLLGALADDDAESLRSAFRKAAKATHPDLNVADPDASSRFRQIVRANAILSDAEQREAYDWLLASARRQYRWKRRRAIVSHMIHKLASGMIAGALVSVVLLGGYTLFGHISNASVIPEQAIEFAAPGPAGIAAAIPTQQSDTIARDESSDQPEDVATRFQAFMPNAAVNMSGAQPAAAPAANMSGAQAAAAPATNTDSAQIAAAPAVNMSGAQIAAAPAVNTGGAPAAVVASAVSTGSAQAASAPAVDTGGAQVAPAPAINMDGAQAMASVGPAPDLAGNDAKSYHERGMAAYRDGDLRRAIANFDLAIQRDPGLAEAYIDRGIVLYRKRQFGRAFADIAQAKRIVYSNRTRPLRLTPPAPIPGVASHVTSAGH
jgi:tetratricopeptide (TPR) repeat protein